MSKYLMLLLVSASLGLTACGKDDKKDDKKGGNQGRVYTKGNFPNVANSIYGRWNAPTEHDKGITFMPRFSFNTNGEMGYETDCITPRGTATAGFVVNARIDHNTIEISEAAEKTERNGDVNCTIRVQPMKFNYVVNGNSLTFVTTDGRGSYSLTRTN